ncbi:DUF1672 family protein [Rossellomorea marisflavi]|uniref:DUF1672 family protein n=1 Tax=Rossellomorea marisflavi TaxID=189381 RepID=UPI00296F83D4|nr:DUF1672 family protein [Rossellomorea marisflavi]MDW4525741.1 DUF1672 family protein [Rossellomorea marisflavi]
MKHKWKLFLCGISISLLLGGCFGVDSGKKSEAKKTDTKQGVDDRPEDRFESVLTYTGEGYDLPGGEENEKIAKEHKDEVVKATKDYLKEKYNTDIEVHNMVGNKDGVTVFFESIGDVHFYSTAIVPIDSDNQKVLSDKVWTLEGEVEKGIETGLYALKMKDEFKNLDSLIESLIEEDKNIVGRKIEALQNVGGNGFMTPYYIVQPLDAEEALKDAYDLYISSSQKNTDEIINSIKEINNEDFLFSIQFFMKTAKEQPNKDTFNKVKESLETSNNLPSGTYVIQINDNYIDKESSEGYKKNSISLEVFEGIKKN